MHDPAHIRYLKTPAYHPTMAVVPIGRGLHRVLNHLEWVVVTDLEEEDLRDTGVSEEWVISGSPWVNIRTLDEDQPYIFELTRIFDDEVHGVTYDWGKHKWRGPPGLIVDLNTLIPLNREEFLKEHVRLWANDNTLDGPRHPAEKSIYKIPTLELGVSTQYISRHQARRTIYDLLLE